MAFEYKVSFSEDYPKLRDNIFPTIRLNKGTTYYKVKRIYTVYIINEKRGFAMLLSKTSLVLGDIPKPLIRYDTYPNVTFDDFYKTMFTFYRKKPQWHGLATMMLLLLFLWIKRI